jgi:hypothetical protein
MELDDQGSRWENLGYIRRRKGPGAMSRLRWRCRI